MTFSIHTNPMSIEPVLIAGEWRPADSTGTFQADNPTTKGSSSGDLSGELLGGLRSVTGSSRFRFRRNAIHVGRTDRRISRGDGKRC